MHTSVPVITAPSTRPHARPRHAAAKRLGGWLRPRAMVCRTFVIGADRGATTGEPHAFVHRRQLDGALLLRHDAVLPR